MIDFFFKNKSTYIIQSKFGNFTYDIDVSRKLPREAFFDKRLAKEALLSLSEVFTQNKITFFLIFGTALGAIRENDFLEHDIDIDIGIFIKEKDKLIYAVDTYQTEITDKNLIAISKQFQHKGNAVVNQIYNLREIKKIHQAFHRYEQAQGTKITALDDFLTKIPELSDILINPNLQKVLSELHKKAELVKNVFYRKVPQNIIEREWFQVNDDKTFVIRIHLKETNRFNYLEVMPGSHKKYFSQEEIELLVKNSVPHVTHVRQGGIHLLQNKILRRWVIKYKDQVSNMIELVYQI